MCMLHRPQLTICGTGAMRPTQSWATWNMWIGPHWRIYWSKLLTYVASRPGLCLIECFNEIVQKECYVTIKVFTPLGLLSSLDSIASKCYRHFAQPLKLVWWALTFCPSHISPSCLHYYLRPAPVRAHASLSYYNLVPCTPNSALKHS